MEKQRFPAIVGGKEAEAAVAYKACDRPVAPRGLYICYCIIVHGPGVILFVSDKRGGLVPRLF